MRCHGRLLLLAISYVCACGDPEPPVAITAPAPLALTPSTQVGTIAGTLSVTPGGSAHYTIGLVMAPGRLGMEPTLKLEYDSGAGTGYLGTGWSLGGLSRITRCTGVPDVDLVERPTIHWDDTDALCLDGQALELVSGGDTPTYRTYPDHATRVTLLDPLDDPEGAFEVRTPDGLIWTYGSSAQAVVPGYGDVPAAWWIRTVRDRFDNQVTYHYDYTPKPSWYEDHRLSRITYTSWQSGSQILEPERSVELIYTPRPTVEHLEGYDHGARTVVTKRLLRIDNVVSHQVVRSYLFGYADGSIKATERSVLSELTTCDGAGACMPPMRFAYSIAGVGRYQHEWDTYPYSRDEDSPDAAIAPVALDANIDGRRDMLVRTGDAYRLFRAVDTSSAAFVPEELPFDVAEGHGLRIGDVDGDGRSDIIEVSSQGVLVHRAGQLGFYNTVEQVAELDDTLRFLDFAVLDFDGDGADDLYACQLPMPEGECQAEEDPEQCDPQPEDCEYEDGEASCDTEDCEPHVDCENYTTTTATWHRINIQDDDSEDTGIECAQECTYTGGCARRASWIVLDHDHDGVDELLQIVDVGTGNFLRTRDLGTDPLGPYDLDPTDNQPPYQPEYEYQAIHGSYDSGDYELVSTGLPPDAFQRYNPGAGRDKIYDVNGDGHDDVVRFEPDNASEWMAYYRACDEDEAPAFSGAHAVAYISTGKGFVTTPIMAFDAWDDLCTEWKRSVAADWTGDGRIDLVYPHDNGDDTADLWVAKSRYPAPSESAPTNIGELSRADMPLVSVDTAGTGFGIAFWHGNQGDEDGSWHLLYRNRTPDLLVGITDGHGSTTEIEYDSLADEDVYRPGGSNAERRGVCDARSVVAAVREPEGLVDRETVYSYYDLEVDIPHRRSLGFTSRTSATRAGVEWLSRTRTEYAKDLVDPGTGLHLFAGVPERVTTWTSLFDTGQHAIDRTSYAHELQVSDDRVFAHVSSSIQQRWDVAAVCDPRDGDGCADPDSLAAPFATRAHVESDWDDLGYARHIVDTDGELTTTQVVDYDIDYEKWLVGQPRRVEITSNAVDDEQLRVIEYTYYTDTGALETMLVSNGLTEERSSYYEYSHTGNVQLVEADGREAEQRNTKIEYDDAEEIFPVRIEDANGRASTVIWYAGLGVPQAIADPNGVTVTVTRDGFGRPTRQVRSAPGKPSDGADQIFTYERMDDVASPTAPSRMRVRRLTNGGADETIELDKHGREEQRRWRGLGGGERYVDVDYDTAGRITRQTLPQVVGLNPTASATYEYDALGRITEYTPATGGATQMSYAGRTTTVTDPRGFIWRRDVDAGGRPKSVTDPYGTTICYYSGAFGAPIGIGVNNGRCLDAPPLIAPVPTKDAWVTRTTYDAHGRVTRVEDPNAGTHRYRYNGFGDLLELTDAADEVTTYVRDRLGRPTSMTDADGETTWEWDDAVAGGKYGLLRASTSPHGVEHEFIYDVFTRLTHDVATVNGETFTTSRQYDAFSRPSKMKYPPGPGGTAFGTTTQYDVYGHATKIVDSATGAEYWRLVATTPAEQLANERFGNGLVSARTYNAGGRLETIKTGTVGSPASIQNLFYGYDASGNLTDRDDLRALQYEQFDYDRVDRLWRGVETKRIGAVEVPAGDWAIVYNRVGAITSKSDVGAYTYGDPAHPLAVTAAGAATHAYDDNGNLVVRNATAITYTGFFAPRVIDGPAVDETLDYDAAGEPMRRREEWAGGSRTTVMVGDFRRITEVSGVVPSVSYEYRITAGGRTIARLRRAPGLGGTVTTVRYVHDDHIGSPDAMTTEGGAIAEDPSYDPWGRPRNPDLAAAGGFADPLAWSQGFTGVDAHASDGLVWHGARPYDPVLARFLAPDPLVSGWASTQGHDRYAYVLDRPLNLVDPSGLAPAETTYYEFDDEDVCSYGGCIDPDPEEAVEFAEANETDFLLGAYFEAPEDEIVLEPYVYSGAEYVGQAALGFKDAVVDSAKAKAPMLVLAYMATNPVLFVAAPLVAGYMGVETAKAVADDPAGALLGMTPIPNAVGIYTGIKNNDVREVVRHGALLTAAVVEGRMAGKALGGKSCFAAGTPVHTERGLVPIEQLVPGDRVIAMDLETGARELRPITEVIVTPDQPVLRIELGDDGGSKLTLDVTATHPIWSHDGWTSAGNLAPGDEVLTLAGGWLRVSSGTWIAARTVYNLEVDGLHDYFVGDDGVLVHNGPCGREPKKFQEKRVNDDGSVTYTKNDYDVTYRNGRADFGPYVREGDDITIELTGNRRLDEARANAARGYKTTPDGYTWHHHEDVSVSGGKIEGRMQLVESQVHNAFPHTGGFAIAKELFQWGE